MGDPFDPETQIRQFAIEDLGIDLEKQVNEYIAMGAQLITGGKRKGAFYEPTILTEVTSDMPVFIEETFGPVAAIKKFKTFDEAIELSNETTFGLGDSMLGENVEEYAAKAHVVEEGAVLCN